MAAAMPVFAGLSILGTATSAYGQIQQGNAAYDVAQQNATLAEANARQADISTADQIDQLFRDTSRTVGTQKAGYGKAGVKREGTVLDVLTNTVNMADRDAYRLSEQGRQAREGFLFQAQQERYAGKVARKNARIGAATTLLTGLGNLGTSAASGGKMSFGGSGFGTANEKQDRINQLKAMSGS